MNRDIEKVLFDADGIRTRIQELGQTISDDLRGSDLVILALLKGGVVILADLIRAIDLPMEVEFAWASSYGDGTESRGKVDLKLFPETDLSQKTVLIVDDILDTGRTLRSVKRKLEDELGATEVRSCVLLDKKARRAVDMEASYVGFEVEDVFVVGYGLDYADRYRNLPYIGILKEHCVKV